MIRHHPGLLQQASSGLSNSGLSSTPPLPLKERGRVVKMLFLFGMSQVRFLAHTSDPLTAFFETFSATKRKSGSSTLQLGHDRFLQRSAHFIIRKRKRLDSM
jgi:hypothetical protein